MPDAALARADWELDAFGPEEVEPEAFAIPGSLDEIMLVYHLPFIRIIDLRNPVADAEVPEVVVSGFGGFGVRVGMLRSMYQRVQRAAQERQVGRLGEDIQLILRDARLNERGLFPDGTVVRGRFEDL